MAARPANTGGWAGVSSSEIHSAFIDRITNGIAKLTWNDGFGNKRNLPLEFVYPTICEDIPDWVDVHGSSCETYASSGWCDDPNHVDYAVDGVSAHEACRASCPNLCGEKRAFYI